MKLKTATLLALVGIIVNLLCYIVPTLIEFKIVNPYDLPTDFWKYFVIIRPISIILVGIFFLVLYIKQR
jgi:hypothetical protein